MGFFAVGSLVLRHLRGSDMLAAIVPAGSARTQGCLFQKGTLPYESLASLDVFMNESYMLAE